MKLSIETKNLSERFGDFKAFELIKNAGFEGIDMTYPKLDKNEKLEESRYYGNGYFEYAHKLRDELDRLGLPKVLSDFVNSLDSNYFGACIDLGHAALTYGLAENFIADTDGSIIKLLHVQECDFERDSHTIPFSGGFNWNGILSNLKNKGYDGDFSFEIFKYLYFFPDEMIPEALRLAEKVGRYLINQYENL